MATIKIPSKNIYSTPTKNSSNNLIETAEIKSNIYKISYGEIARITIVPFELNSKGEFVWVCADEDSNDTFDLWSFFIHGDVEYLVNYDYSSKEVKPLVFTLKNSSYIKYKANGSPLNCELSITEYFSDSSGEIQSFTYKYTNRLLYNKDTNTLVYYDPNNTKKDPITDDDYGDLYPLLFRRVQKSGNQYVTSLVLSVSGDYIDGETKIQKYSVDESSNNKISLANNELIQRGCTYTVSTSSKPLYVPRMLSQVVSKHKNGKEVYTIKCSVGNYYDTSGKLTISPEKDDYPAIFNKYDIVEPYVFGYKGEVPLSTNADGTAKKFEVIGVDFTYNGVPWQELTIQEYT